MTLNQLGDLFLKQAEEKGWGHTKDDLVVSEKMVLMHTEVSEMYEALKKKPKRPKDTIEMECADILGRTLHLGRAWGVNFDEKPEFRSYIKFPKNNREAMTATNLVYLHSLISKSYDNYRHKKVKVFLRMLVKIAYEMMNIAKLLEIDVIKSALEKIEINKSRTWSAKKLNGNYSK